MKQKVCGQDYFSQLSTASRAVDSFFAFVEL